LRLLSGFKSAAAKRNLLKQVGALGNRLQPVLGGSGGIHPASLRLTQRNISRKDAKNAKLRNFLGLAFFASSAFFA